MADLCQTCGSPLTSGTKQRRFCCNQCQRQCLATYRPAQDKKAAVLSGLMKPGEIPKPPRSSGPVPYSAETREAVHPVKTGSRISDPTAEQQILDRACNRENHAGSNRAAESCVGHDTPRTGAPP